jgi:hypothetical protein
MATEYRHLGRVPQYHASGEATSEQPREMKSEDTVINLLTRSSSRFSKEVEYCPQNVRLVSRSDVFYPPENSEAFLLPFYEASTGPFSSRHRFISSTL